MGQPTGNAWRLYRRTRVAKKGMGDSTGNVRVTHGNAPLEGIGDRTRNCTTGRTELPTRMAWKVTKGTTQGRCSCECSGNAWQNAQVMHFLLYSMRVFPCFFSFVPSCDSLCLPCLAAMRFRCVPYGVPVRFMRLPPCIFQNVPTCILSSLECFGEFVVRCLPSSVSSPCVLGALLVAFPYVICCAFRATTCVPCAFTRASHSSHS